MLDVDTKRRIDTARDILVGKVPDPKSQVEQITIALIYKFMDDLDAESEELGGERNFFSGDFARYGWGQVDASEPRRVRHAEPLRRGNNQDAGESRYSPVVQRYIQQCLFALSRP